ncbi:MAG: BolA/IbaG family iron-sulfur metabolism protein [Halieaceae bacterium]|jgi:BolA protein|nr:BolA/IbaG family iron-sulfur metabolism protein [Halieaceae bacterium]
MSIQSIIEQKLVAALLPAHLEVENESHQHSVPPNSETHFKVVVVADAFDGRRKVARHQAIYGLLADELAGPVHALALHTYTPDEWTQRLGEAPLSPQCLGGSKAESGS